VTVKLPLSWREIATWALTAVLASFFLVAGGLKLAGAQAQVDNFAHWGYAAWFLYVVGAVEASGAVGLLVPRLAVFAALLLGATMVGASLTHLVHNEMKAVPIPLVILGLLAIVGYARRGPLIALYERWLDS
jgi:uncharacterized membrane protein YphA (DoxX/SURF4 family)